MLVEVCGTLPGAVDRDEGGGILSGAADVEFRRIDRGVDLGREIADVPLCGAGTAACACSGEDEYEG